MSLVCETTSLNIFSPLNKQFHWSLYFQRFSPKPQRNILFFFVHSFSDTSHSHFVVGDHPWNLFSSVSERLIDEASPSYTVDGEKKFETDPGGSVIYTSDLKLGYDKAEACWFLNPNDGLEFSLRRLQVDQDLRNMTRYCHENNNVIDIYFEHGPSVPNIIDVMDLSKTEDDDDHAISYKVRMEGMEEVRIEDVEAVKETSTILSQLEEPITFHIPVELKSTASSPLSTTQSPQPTAPQSTGPKPTPPKSTAPKINVPKHCSQAKSPKFLPQQNLIASKLISHKVLSQPNPPTNNAQTKKSSASKKQAKPINFKFNTSTKMPRRYITRSQGWRKQVNKEPVRLNIDSSSDSYECAEDGLCKPHMPLGCVDLSSDNDDDVGSSSDRRKRKASNDNDKHKKKATSDEDILRPPSMDASDYEKEVM
ncbi:hypothetical protein Ahy_B09g099238 [Arachis hypogaea]|uniref:PB1-like domain-containing protein n=1 Tax=Arachis hypogaea TaxID=3818 RepID=A0A444XT89_ARAHY|nr:hypothetical protein Ahy_B09g099238 [Arachis hypogaea]